MTVPSTVEGRVSYSIRRSVEVAGNEKEDIDHGF